ncbi:MAG: site-specific DNA-methyltransferase [Bacteroidetes bacterium]|nr:site-specific DNA-methyltransferase [Bacteroidota bacterium]
MAIKNKLKEILLKNEKFKAVTEEDIVVLNTTIIMECARNYDTELLALLQINTEIKNHFFSTIAPTQGQAPVITIFKLEKFIAFISNYKYLPDSFTIYKKKIGLATNNNNYLANNQNVVLNWAYKDCILEGGQTKDDQKRKEIFFNEILAPDQINRLLDDKVFTNFKRYDKNGVHDLAELKNDDNMIIKGNNLVVLHSLKKRFAGKIKLIYIDPPYNTQTDANTFAYNNNFNHSTWLTFMKNRLEVARDLLREDGFISIDIDHYELFYLGVLADEIFGRDNRLGVISVVTNPAGRDNKFFASAHENKLIYAKNKRLAEIGNFNISDTSKKQYSLEDGLGKYKLTALQRTGDGSKREDRPNLFYPIYYLEEDNIISIEKKANAIEILPIDGNGIERRWRWSAAKISRDWQTELQVKKTNEKYKIYVKDRLGDGNVKPKSFWMKPEYAGMTGTNEIKKLLGEKVFTYPKSVYLVKDTIKILSEDDDIILDFFGGSGTTAHAVLELNKEDGGSRQFILCEQMNYIHNVTTKRVQKVIENHQNGDFVYLELANDSEDFRNEVRRADAAKLPILFEKVKHSSFLSYRVNTEEFNGFEALTEQEQRQLLLELVDANTLYINYTDIESEDYNISKKDKELNKQFYMI